MAGETDPIVEAALRRGFVTPAALEAARELDRSLAAEGRSPGLRALLAQRFLRPEQVQALRDEALAATHADAAPGPGATHGDGPEPGPPARGRSARTLAAGGDMAPTAADTTGVLRPLDLPAGAVVGGYTIERQLGRGGMGAVYAARDPGTGATVAVKLMAATDGRALERFRREGVAQAAADRHPNVLRVFASGEHQGAPFLVMELAPGGDLSKRLAQGPMAPADAALLVAHLARGLAHVHQKGVLHRDLKPANVMFGADGTPKLVDFGVARLRGEQDLTRTGDLVGTPAYMAPEQAEGVRGGVDERSDVYGLGAILYHAVTGRPPFVGDGMHQVLKGVLMDPPATPSSVARGLPPAVDHVVLKALSKDPNDRYASARALAEDLERLARGEDVVGRDEAGARRRARMRLRALAALAAAVVLTAGGVGLWRTWPTLSAMFTSTSAPPPPEPATGALTSVHAKTTTRLGWVTIDAEVKGDARAVRVVVGTSAVPGAASEAGAGREVVTPWRFTGRAPLALGPNVIALEAQHPDSARWARVAELRVERLPAFDPPPPERVVDRQGRALAFDEAREVFLAHDGSILVYVPPTKFRMGSGDCVYVVDIDESNSLLNRQPTRVALPEHDVTLTRGFLIGVHEVSWGQFDAFRRAAGLGGEGARRPDGWADDMPANDVSWVEAAAYCEWHGLELPTEAQWELAARGPDARRYPWGDDDRDAAKLAVFNERRAREDETERRAERGPVPTRPPSPVSAARPESASWVGALHMAGNVWEWTRDSFMPSYELLAPSGKAVTDPLYLIEGRPPHAKLTLRGGSWLSSVWRCHAAYRFPKDGDLGRGDPDARRRDHEEDVGFRVILTLPE